MSKKNWLVWYAPIAALLFLVPLCHGMAGGTDRARIDGGHGLGARNRLPGA